MGLVKYILVALLAIVGFRVVQLYQDLGFGKEHILKYNDEKCKLVNVPLNSEDITVLSEGVVIFGNSDFNGTLHYGEVSPGAIYTMDVRTDPPTFAPVPLLDLPDDFILVPHGIYLSNKTAKLYVVSHGLTHGGSRVVVFRLHGRHPELRLRYEHSITSPLFENAVINDVVEGRTDDEVYVTRWLRFPLPLTGVRQPASLQDHLHKLGNLAAQLFLPLTGVFHCTREGPSFICSVAATGLKGANGVTIDAQRTTLYVVDAPGKAVYIYDINQQDGSLILQKVIPTPHILDNIDYEPEGSLMAGSVPVAHLALKMLEGHPARVPGGALLISPDHSMEDLVLSDGAKLNEVSAAVRTHGKYVMGSPFDEGLLVCDA